MNILYELSAFNTITGMLTFLQDFISDVDHDTGLEAWYFTITLNELNVSVVYDKSEDDITINIS